VLFLNIGSPTGGVYLLSYKRGEYSFKGGELSFRGSNHFRGQVFDCFLYDFNVFLLVFDSKGGEVLGTKANSKYIKYQTPPNLKFKNLSLQAVLVLQVFLV
jgi:hypothetical protein